MRVLIDWFGEWLAKHVLVEARWWQLSLAGGPNSLAGTCRRTGTCRRAGTGMTTVAVVSGAFGAAVRPAHGSLRYRVSWRLVARMAPHQPVRPRCQCFEQA